MGKLVIAFCFVSAAFGQNVDRVFRLTNATAPMSLQAIATTLRTVARIQQISVDNAVATLTVKGTADPIALAEWLVPQLDVAPGTNPGLREHRVSGDADDVVLVCQLAHTTTPQGAQEIVTALRIVADIQKIFNVTAPAVIALRGNASQIALAEFLLSELDQEPVQARPTPLIHEFKTGGRDDAVVVYGLAHPETPRDMQEIITTLRTILGIQRIFQVTGPKLLAVRGDADQVRMAEWLIPELDREAANVGANPGANEARVPGGDEVVHVFYLAHLTSAADMGRLIGQSRAMTRFPRAFARTVPAALVLRGTTDQIAMAGHLIELSDHPAP